MTRTACKSSVMTSLLPLPCSRSSLICEHSDAKGRAADTKEPTIECTSRHDFWTQLFHRRPPGATLNYCVAAPDIYCVGPRPASHFNAQHPGALINFSVGGPNAVPPSGSGELAHRRLAIPESHPRSFDKVLAETSHTCLGCDAGFVEQRLGSLARTDRFQVSECIHDE